MDKGGEMQTVYRLNVNELNNAFIESLKSMFKDKEIEIAVYEVDETAYLMSSEANRARLLSAVRNVKNNNNLVEAAIE